MNQIHKERELECNSCFFFIKKNMELNLGLDQGVGEKIACVMQAEGNYYSYILCFLLIRSQKQLIK